MYHITEAEIARYVLSCAQKQVFLPCKKAFSQVNIPRSSGIFCNKLMVSNIVNPNILMVESVQLSWPTEGHNFSKKGGSFGL